jgi:predicted glycoside hydrolase/deacetylase ChbG (UPF0249 family)
MMSGLLIVNADDWGHDVATTNAIVDCFARRRITSTTAMVHMADSERASELARETDIPAGLHLNLSEPYSGTGIPVSVRERQERLVRKFSGRSLTLRRWLYDPSIQGQVEDCISDQLECFEALYRAVPTHVDGHKHAHVCLNVLAARTLPTGTRLRNYLYEPRRTRRALAPFRRLRSRLLERRFLSTDWLLDASEWATALQLSPKSTVELMVHPELRDRDLLLSQSWSDALESQRLGSFKDLERRL